jgi:hypothetical protein
MPDSPLLLAAVERIAELRGVLGAAFDAVDDADAVQAVLEQIMPDVAALAARPAEAAASVFFPTANLIRRVYDLVDDLPPDVAAQLLDTEALFRACVDADAHRKLFAST